MRPTVKPLTAGTLLAQLTMLAAVGLTGLGILLFAMLWLQGGADPTVHALAVISLLAGGFIGVGVIARAIVLRAGFPMSRRQR